MKKNKPPQLGRTLTKNKRNTNSDGFLSNHHTAELADGYDWGRLNLQSVTEESALDDFLHTAELAGTDFTAEKLNVKFIKPSSKVGILSTTDDVQIKKAQKENIQLLSIPRRPEWDESTSAVELQQREAQSFLDWRRKLAELETLDHITLTPYEKNLEFWRQLWRVIERSDIVVQIVDSRNPLLFRCEDMEIYVKEVGSTKINMVLMNKADLLTAKQRQSWSSYFKSIGVQAVFFSALEELNCEESEELEKTEDSNNVNWDEISKNNISCDGHLLNKSELIKLFKTIPLEKRCKEGLTTVGLVGYPNVGKSSTINAIFKEKKVSVSATPGKTKHFQTLNIDTSLCLCDCPGLVMPTFVSSKAEMILNGILPIDQMRDYLPPSNLLCHLIPRHIIESKYSMVLPKPQEGEDPDRPPYAEEMLNAFGYLRGFMTQRGLPDGARSARILLKDYVSGKLLYCMSPPDVPQADYHVYVEENIKPKINASSLAVEKMKSLTETLDTDFFNTLHSNAHVLGKQIIPQVASNTGEAGGSSTFSSTTSLESKPWKKHNNRKKKEKLRRIYAHHDTNC